MYDKVSDAVWDPAACAKIIVRAVHANTWIFVNGDLVGEMDTKMSGCFKSFTGFNTEAPNEPQLARRSCFGRPFSLNRANLLNSHADLAGSCYNGASP